MEPTAETVKHLESRSKLYADDRKKQQLDALEKGITEAKSKLEAAKAKAAKAKPKDAKDAKDPKDAKAEPSPEEAAVLDCERKLQAAEKAKARTEETPPELQEAPFLDKARPPRCAKTYTQYILGLQPSAARSSTAWWPWTTSPQARFHGGTAWTFLDSCLAGCCASPVRLFRCSCGKVESQRRRHGHGEAWWHSRLR